MTAIIFNILILLCEIRALMICWPNRGWSLLFFYTQLSNMVTTVSSVLLLIAGQYAFVAPVRYLGTCMLIMTFFVITCVLIPMGGDPKKLLWSGSGIYHHLLCPVLSTVSYLLFETHADRTRILLPVIVTLIYGLVMVFLNAKRLVDGPYPFFRVHHQSVRATVLWILVLLSVVAAISAGVSLIAGV